MAGARPRYPGPNPASSVHRGICAGGFSVGRCTDQHPFCCILRKPSGAALLLRVQPAAKPSRPGDPCHGLSVFDEPTALRHDLAHLHLLVLPALVAGGSRARVRLARVIAVATGRYEPVARGFSTRGNGFPTHANGRCRSWAHSPRFAFRRRGGASRQTRY